MQKHISYLNDEAALISINAEGKHPLNCCSLWSSRDDSHPHIVKGKHRTLVEKTSHQISLFN